MFIIRAINNVISDNISQYYTINENGVLLVLLADIERAFSRRTKIKTKK